MNPDFIFSFLTLWWPILEHEKLDVSYEMVVEERKNKQTLKSL